MNYRLRLIIVATAAALVDHFLGCEKANKKTRQSQQ